MSLELVKAKLLARIELSKKLIIFIENALEAKVSQEELDAFCIDIFSQKAGRPLEVLPSLKNAINTSIRTYEKMIVICEQDNKPVSIGQFDLLLEYESLILEKLIKSLSAQNPAFEKSAKYLREEKAFFYDLRCLIKPDWPAFFQYLRGHFYFRLMNQNYNKFEKHRAQKKELKFDVVFDFEKAAKDAFELFPKRYRQYRPDISTAEGKKIKEIVAKLSDATERYIAQTKLLLSSDTQNQFSNLAGNAAGFHAVVLKIKAEFSIIYNTIIEKNQREIFHQELANYIDQNQQTLIKFHLQFKAQQTLFDEVKQSFPLVQDSAIELLFKKITIAQKLITLKTKEIETALNTLIVQPNITFEELNKIKKSIDFSSKFVKQTLRSYSCDIKEYTELSQKWAEKKRLDELLVAKQEKEEFILAQKNLLLLWKSQVESNRQAKEKLKATNIIKLPVATTDAQNETQSDLEIEGIAKLLKTLSDKWINLIKGIFCKAKGITYLQVYYLVTNQLGGQIIEHGGGSSHKTMILKNFATEFVTDQVLPEIMKSGICKPHGKAHESGELCGFNLELIQEGLVKVGITPEVIDTLEQEKLNHIFKKIIL